MKSWPQKWKKVTCQSKNWCPGVGRSTFWKHPPRGGSKTPQKRGQKWSKTQTIFKSKKGLKKVGVLDPFLAYGDSPQKKHETDVRMIEKSSSKKRHTIFPTPPLNEKPVRTTGPWVVGSRLEAVPGTPQSGHFDHNYNVIDPKKGFEITISRVPKNLGRYPPGPPFKWSKSPP